MRERTVGELLLVIGVARPTSRARATLSDCYYPTGHFVAPRKTYLPYDGCFASIPLRKFSARVYACVCMYVYGRGKKGEAAVLRRPPRACRYYAWLSSKEYDLSKPITRCVITPFFSRLSILFPVRTYRILQIALL